MIKGDMCRFEHEGKTLYGTILSIVNNECEITFHSYSTGETKKVFININEIVKIGSRFTSTKKYSFIVYA